MDSNMAYRNTVGAFYCTGHIELIAQKPSLKLLSFEYSLDARATCVSRFTITLQVPTSSYLFPVPKMCEIPAFFSMEPV
jgi:hypothetical protein